MLRGTKRKIEIQTRETKQQRSDVACNKRHKTNTSFLTEIYGVNSSNFASLGQNPNSCSLDEIYGGSSSQIGTYGQNPNSCSLDETYGGSSSQISSYGQNPSSFVEEIQGGYVLGEAKEEKNKLIRVKQEPRSEPVVNVGGSDDVGGFWENLYNNDVFGLNSDEDGNCMIDIADFVTKEELELFYGGSSSQIATFSQNPSSFVEEIRAGSSSSDQPSCLENNGLLKTKEEKNNSMSVTQETRSEPMVGGSDVDIFWKKLCNDDVFGLINNTQANNTNEEDDFMIEIGDILTEEYIELLRP